MKANVCWPNSPYWHDRRLSVLFQFSPAKCSGNPSNYSSYVFTNKCSFLTSKSLLSYIFHRWQCPFMNHHVCDVSNANCPFLRTQRSTHFCKIAFCLSEETDFSLTLCHIPNKGWQSNPDETAVRNAAPGRSWAPCLFSFDFPLEVLKSRLSFIQSTNAR